jgi:hypothetical protein
MNKTLSGGTKMALSIDSKLKDLVANPITCDILVEHWEGFDPDSPELARGLNMSLRALAGFPQSGIDEDAKQAITAALEAANVPEAH